MKIIGLDNHTIDDINFELSRGGKFIVYQYCFSFLVMTCKRDSDIYFIQSDESSITKGLKYVGGFHGDQFIQYRLLLVIYRWEGRY